MSLCHERVAFTKRMSRVTGERGGATGVCTWCPFASNWSARTHAPLGPDSSAVCTRLQATTIEACRPERPAVDNGFSYTRNSWVRISPRTFGKGAARSIEPRGTQDAMAASAGVVAAWHACRDEDASPSEWLNAAAKTIGHAVDSADFAAWLDESDPLRSVRNKEAAPVVPPV